MGRIHATIIFFSVLSLIGLSTLVLYLKHLSQNKIKIIELFTVILICVGFQIPLFLFLLFLKKQGILIF